MFKCKFCRKQFKTRAGRATHQNFKHSSLAKNIDPESVTSLRNNGGSWRSIAEILGVSPGGVRSAYKKAKQTKGLAVPPALAPTPKPTSPVTLTYREGLLQMKAHIEKQRIILLAQIEAIDMALKSFPSQ